MADDQEHPEHTTGGTYSVKGKEFTRDTRYITTRITLGGEDGFPVEAGRYRLVAARACPWANRAIIVRRLLGLEDALSLGLPGPTHDGLSALTAMRTLNFAPGATSSFAVSDSGHLYRVALNVTGKETVQTGLGPVAAWKIVPAIRDAEGQAVGRGLAVWISDDARRLPVKIQAQLPVGAFVLTLEEAR